MCKAIDDMLADAREEGRKETMNGLQEMIAGCQRRRAKGNDERFAGNDSGCPERKGEGNDERLQEMIADAREEGESKGRNEERERIIQILVNDNFTSGISKENFCEKLQNMFSMDQKTAENYMKRFSG